MNRKVSLFIVLTIIGLILFDSAQQKYYVETFNLNGEKSVSYLALLQTHLIRWAFWALLVMPLSLVFWSRHFKSSKLTPKNWGLIISFYTGATVLSLAILSFQSIIVQGVGMNAFGELFEFFVFQKGLSFLLASMLLILLLFNQSKIITISGQEIVIESLTRKTNDLEEVLNQGEIPHINIKIGYKLIPVALEDISWIQSDDYCVKIHTGENTYTLRQSLKALQEKLSPYRFVRIHRSALLNLNYIDQINFETAKVKLLDSTEIPYSKNGIKDLKKEMEDISG